MLPSYFMALNKDYRYLFTPIRSFCQLAVNQEVYNDGTAENPRPNFKVMATEPCSFSWQVTGVRKDRFALTNPIIPEVVKDTPYYLHPELWK
jgi:hypothetical protein